MRLSRSCRRRSTGLFGLELSLIAAAVLAATPARVVGEGSYLGSYGDWEAHVYRIDPAEVRCALRALHPAIIEAEIYWIFNTRNADRLPDGFLAVDRRIADGASDLAVVVDGRDRFALKIGDDGHGYSLASDAGSLIAAMRRGLTMDVIVTRRTAGRRVLTVSLIGFTRGSEAARAACFSR